MTDVVSIPKARANARLSFSAITPDLQIAWDSTSLGTAKKCWRKYKLSIVDGWQSKGTSLHLRYGIIYHKGLEVYDHHICLGATHDVATREAVRKVAEMCMDGGWTGNKCPKCNGTGQVREDGDGEEIKCTGCGGTGEEYVDRKWWDTNEGLSEKVAAANTKTVPNLIRSIVWYLERFGPNDPAKTVVLANGKPAVELSFRFDGGLQFSTGEELILCGHMDRVVTFNSGLYVLDRKTTKTTIDGFSAQKYFAQFSPNNQMSLYGLAGTIVLGTAIKGVIIDAVQIAKGFSRYERGFANRTEGQLQEWLDDTLYYIRQAEANARSGVWPMNDTACSDFGGCPFQGICNKDPAVRETFLRSNFERRLWDPLENRGDI